MQHLCQLQVISRVLSYFFIIGIVIRFHEILIFSVQIPKNTITAGSFRAKKLHTDIAKVQNDLAEDGSNANTGI